MGAENNGLTLEGLAHKLETLQRENAERLETLERENAGLRAEVSALRGSGTPRNEVPALRGSDTRRSGEAALAFDGRVSRRSLLSKAGAAAVAAVAAGTLLNPREAKADHNSYFHTLYASKVLVHEGDALTSLSATNGYGAEALWGRTSSASKAAVHGENEDSGPGVRGRAAAITGTGVEGTATGSLGYGVQGTGFSGVWGESDRSGGRGVMGINSSADGTGVKGTTNNTDGHAGVRGEGRIGVLGISPNVEQAGVKGEGTTGVWGVTTTRDYAGVYGENKGTKGIGTVGIGKGDDTGVLGRNPTGQGLRGEGRYGVVAVGGSTGYGGRFEGGKAQLMLKPGGSAGKPTTGTHKKGEIYMDSAGALFVCTAGDGTTLGTWKKLTMKLV